MICTECRNAGDANGLLNTGTAPDEMEYTLQQAADEFHKRCKGGTWCDCQHKLGKHLLSFSAS